jgi:hypothetical protein
MAALRDDIAAYAKLRADLEADSLGKWVLVHDQVLEGRFDSFDEAARVAVRRFGRGPYLIRQIGAGAVTMPVSVMYSQAHGNDQMRV